MSQEEEQEEEPHLISSYNKGTIGLYLREGEWLVSEEFFREENFFGMRIFSG